MRPVTTSGPVRGRFKRGLTAGLIIAGGVLLAGCSASMVADHMPTAVGGLPEDAPKRAETTGAFPAVHDRPPVRGSTVMTVDEQKRLEDDLAAARARVEAAANPPAGSAAKP